MVQAEAVDLPDIQDISPEEEKEKFDKIKKELMDFAKGFQWGVWVRSMIYHWKSYPEAVSALAEPCRQYILHESPALFFW